MARSNDRGAEELRPIRITTDYLKFAEGSALIEMGDTKVLCSASIEDKLPSFLKNSGRGWLTAEYAMLPASTSTRAARESTIGRLGGRTHEIQRLIGRSLRAVTDLTTFGERTVTIDCDVIQADGGTRTAAVTGGFIALAGLFRRQKEKGVIDRIPLRDYVSAVSVGLVNGQVLLDLAYGEDSRAEVDMNFVMTGDGRFIEVQGTAERKPFDRGLMQAMTNVAVKGIGELIRVQRSILGGTL
ncbi:MAG TPA: ribonuclease PH [Syntrophales bacterium]|nr:ribonuclease PH [Syntrophales bacterium]